MRASQLYEGGAERLVGAHEHSVVLASALCREACSPTRKFRDRRFRFGSHRLTDKHGMGHVSATKRAESAEELREHLRGSWRAREQRSS